MPVSATAPNPTLAPAARTSALQPLPPGLPDVAYDGALIGAGGVVFPRETPLADIPPFQPESGQAKEELIYVNGVRTSFADAVDTAQELANQTSHAVVCLYNASTGLASDIAQTIRDKFKRGKNPAIDSLAEHVYRQAMSGESVHLVAHSQGAVITARAIAKASHRMMLEDGLSADDVKAKLKQFVVETFGGATSRFPDGPQYKHHVNKFDAIARVFGVGAGKLPWAKLGEGAEIDVFSKLRVPEGHPHSMRRLYAQRITDGFEPA